jgi:hypothetical protein
MHVLPYTFLGSQPKQPQPTAADVRSGFSRLMLLNLRIPFRTCVLSAGAEAESGLGLSSEAGFSPLPWQFPESSALQAHPLVLRDPSPGDRASRQAGQQ